MSKKYFEKRWYFTDGILIAEVIGMKNKDFYGVDVTTRFRNIIIGHASYTASEFGTYGNAKQYALHSLKNSHFKKIEDPDNPA